MVNTEAKPLYGNCVSVNIDANASDMVDMVGSAFIHQILMPIPADWRIWMPIPAPWTTYGCQLQGYIAIIGNKLPGITQTLKKLPVVSYQVLEPRL